MLVTALMMDTKLIDVCPPMQLLLHCALLFRCVGDQVEEEWVGAYLSSLPAFSQFPATAVLKLGK